MSTGMTGRGRAVRGRAGAVTAALAASAMALASLASTVWAGEADVREATLTAMGDGTFRATVTVAHGDEGWDHYADLWVVLAPDGTVLGERVLAHPHETEQPFTRSLSGIVIPDDIEFVIIRARDSVHGFGGAEVTVTVPR